jgi:CMP-N-acetylneuraminic acid synthetase
MATRPTCLATGFVCKYVPFGSADDGTTELHGRQKIEGFFYDDGSIYVVDAATIRAGRQYGERLEHLHNCREGSVEVDDEFDLWLVERILMRREAEGRS